MLFHSSQSVEPTHKSVSPPQAETRAEFAERSVAKLEKTIDDLEGMIFPNPTLLILKCLLCQSWYLGKCLVLFTNLFRPFFCFALLLCFCFPLNSIMPPFSDRIILLLWCSLLLSLFNLVDFVF